MNKNEYLDRELIDTEGGSFGVGDIQRDMKTRKITSKARAYDGYEVLNNMLIMVRQAVAKKAKISYPKETILLLNCYFDRIPLLNEWEDMVKDLKATPPGHAFRELFLIEAARHSHTASLYPPQQHQG